MKTYILNSTKALAAIAFMTGAVVISVPASAITTQGDTITTKIDARDLETDRGLAHIYDALERRAERACITGGQKSISARRLEDACAEALLMDFVQNVDDARLTSYYEKMQS